MLQIHQIPLVAAGKAPALQGFLHLLEGGGGGVDAGAGVEHQLAPQALDIIDAVHRQLDGASLYGHREAGVLLLLHILQRPAQPLGEGKVVQRLQNVVQRVHGIALDGILGQVGDKDDDHLRVLFPDIARRRHAVHEGHLHIHQNQVEFRPVALHQVLAVVIVGDLEGAPRLPAVVANKLLQLGKTLGVVLGDGNAYHGALLLPFPWLNSQASLSQPNSSPSISPPLATATWWVHRLG